MKAKPPLSPPRLRGGGKTGGGHAIGQRLVGESKRGVEAKRGCDLRFAICDLRFGKAHVFSDAGPRLVPTVAVGDFVAQAGSQPRPDDCLCDQIQAAVNGGRAGVMIDQRGGAVLDGVHQADQRAVFDVLLQQRPVQPPPELAQDFGKVAGRVTGDGHAPGKGPIKVGVAADVARHDELPTGVHGLVLRVGLFQLGGVPDICNQRSIHADSALFDYFIGLAKGDDASICDQHAYPPVLGAGITNPEFRIYEPRIYESRFSLKARHTRSGVKGSERRRTPVAW